jgi:spore germination protein YaaH
MQAVDRKAIDRMERSVRRVLRWQGSNVAFCVVNRAGGKQFIRFRWREDLRSHERVQFFEPQEPRIITFATYR